MTNRTLLLLLCSLLAAALPGCPTSSTPQGESKPKTAVLLRTYFVPLRADVEMGPNRPPLDKFIDSGSMPGSQDGKDQLRALQSRYTLKALAFISLRRDEQDRARHILDTLKWLDPTGQVGWPVIAALADGLTAG